MPHITVEYIDKALIIRISDMVAKDPNIPISLNTDFFTIADQIKRAKIRNYERLVELLANSRNDAFVITEEDEEWLNG